MLIVLIVIDIARHLDHLDKATDLDKKTREGLDSLLTASQQSSRPFPDGASFYDMLTLSLMGTSIHCGEASLETKRAFYGFVGSVMEHQYLKQQNEAPTLPSMTPVTFCAIPSIRQGSPDVFGRRPAADAKWSMGATVLWRDMISG